MSRMSDHDYNPTQPMNDSGDLATDLLNTVKDVGTNGGVETGQYSAIGDDDDVPGDSK